MPPVCFCRRRNLPGHLPGLHAHGLQWPRQAEPLPAVWQPKTLTGRGRSPLTVQDAVHSVRHKTLCGETFYSSSSSSSNITERWSWLATPQSDPCRQTLCGWSSVSPSLLYPFGLAAVKTTSILFIQGGTHVSVGPASQQDFLQQVNGTVLKTSESICKSENEMNPWAQPECRAAFRADRLFFTFLCHTSWPKSFCFVFSLFKRAASEWKRQVWDRLLNSLQDFSVCRRILFLRLFLAWKSGSSEGSGDLTATCLLLRFYLFCTYPIVLNCHSRLPVSMVRVWHVKCCTVGDF